MRHTLFAILVTIIIFTNISSAQTVGVTGNFGGYESGNLNNQDGWSNIWNSLIIQDQVLFNDLKVVKNQISFGAAGYKNLPPEFSETGVLSTSIKIENNNFSDAVGIVGIFKGAGEEYLVLLRFANNFDKYENTMLVSVADSLDIVASKPFAQGVWHKVSIGWRISDYKIRLKIDDGEWSEWFDSQTSWKSGRSLGVKVELPAANEYGDFYVANIDLSQ